MTMLKEWEQMVAKEGSSCEIDVWSSLSFMSADVIARSAFGTSYKEGKRLFKLQDEHVSLSYQMLRSVTNYIPGWRYNLLSSLHAFLFLKRYGLTFYTIYV